MKNLEDNKLAKQFSPLKDYTKAPPPALKAKVMDGVREKRRKKRFFWWLFVFIGILTSVLISFGANTVQELPVLEVKKFAKQSTVSVELNHRSTFESLPTAVTGLGTRFTSDSDPIQPIEKMAFEIGVIEASFKADLLENYQPSDALISLDDKEAPKEINTDFLSDSIQSTMELMPEVNIPASNSKKTQHWLYFDGGGLKPVNAIINETTNGYSLSGKVANAPFVGSGYGWKFTNGLTIQVGANIGKLNADLAGQKDSVLVPGEWVYGDPYFDVDLLDTDGDGIPDAIDHNWDGMPDVELWGGEGVDSNGDGVPDYIEEAIDNDEIPGFPDRVVDSTYVDPTMGIANRRDIFKAYQFTLPLVLGYQFTLSKHFALEATLGLDFVFARINRQVYNAIGTDEYWSSVTTNRFGLNGQGRLNFLYSYKSVVFMLGGGYLHPMTSNFNGLNMQKWQVGAGLRFKL